MPAASDRLIAAAVGVSRYTVAEYLRRAAVVGIAWPVPAGLDDAALGSACSARPSRREAPAAGLGARPRRTAAARGDAAAAVAGVPGRASGRLWLQPLLQPLRRVAPGVAATMRQTHLAGEKLFVDFAGETVPVVDPATGEARPAQVFVAVLGASSLTYAEARWSQGLADWIGCHVHAFAFFGGVPRLLVCDNLKAGVTAACRYEPGINRTYQEMAAHYGARGAGAGAQAARQSQGRGGVQVVERWILARLRHRRLFSLRSPTPPSARCWRR